MSDLTKILRQTPKNDELDAINITLGYLTDFISIAFEEFGNSINKILEEIQILKEQQAKAMISSVPSSSISLTHPPNLPLPMPNLSPPPPPLLPLNKVITSAQTLKLSVMQELKDLFNKTRKNTDD
jgi:hypothetical protein